VAQSDLMKKTEIKIALTCLMIALSGVSNFCKMPSM